MSLRWPWRQVLGTTLVFAALGPLAGALPWFVTMLYETIALGHGALTLDTVAGSLFALAVFAYMFGLIPAALAGVVAGFARQRWSGWRWVLACALIGLGVATVYGMVIFIDWRDGSFVSNLLQAAFILGLPGLLGGALASAVLARRRANTSG